MNSDWLSRLVSLGFLLGLICSYELWFEIERSFPRVPILGFATGTFALAEYLLTPFLFASLLFLIWKPSNRYVTIGAVAAVCFLFVPDQIRLQPWVYQYVLLLVLLAFQKEDLLPVRLVVAGLYFWSGVQKLNAGFSEDVLPRMFEMLGTEPIASVGLGLAIAVVEMMLAVFLFVPKTRKVGVVAVVAMHLLIVGVLATANYNLIVIPWNLTLAIVVVVLFWDQSENKTDWNSPLVYIAFGALILPVFSFVGYWDHYLSGGLYSGREPVAVIRVVDVEALPPSAKSVMISDSRGNRFLPLHEWSMNELNVPVPPEERVFVKVFKRVCQWTDRQSELVIKSRVGVFGDEIEIAQRKCQGREGGK